MRLLLLLFGLLLAVPGAEAQGFELPGLSGDAEAWQRELTRRFPAGATAQQKAAAEQRAAQAERAANWPAAAQAWEERIAGGDAKPEHWLALARAELQKSPPDASRALQAAWFNFQAVAAGEAEIPSLLLMADALQRLDRPAQQIQALNAVLERAPNNPRYRQCSPRPGATPAC
ncbi:hypothetical protein ACFQY5_14585 [Paeniroseomonas aquatica]|uniref:hypothetical protein n=1 Tax=Paeniroseomonas aquatica TaxID=373043 RepID=UPI00361FDA99